MQILAIISAAGEIIGTAAFSVAGALTAIDRGLDLFGVLFISCITATGGGILRDLTIGHYPPSVFENRTMLLIALAASLAVFLLAFFFRKNYHTFHDKVDVVNNVFDAVGLAFFSVSGSRIVLESQFGSNAVLVLVLGMLTGVGGGILRDMMTNHTPDVFKKHIYALASLGGSGVYLLLLRMGAAQINANWAGVLFVFVIRMLATRYRWQLPVIQTNKNVQHAENRKTQKT